MRAWGELPGGGSKERPEEHSQGKRGRVCGVREEGSTGKVWVAGPPGVWRRWQGGKAGRWAVSEAEMTVWSLS